MSSFFCGASLRRECQPAAAQEARRRELPYTDVPQPRKLTALSCTLSSRSHENNTYSLYPLFPPPPTSRQIQSSAVRRTNLTRAISRFRRSRIGDFARSLPRRLSGHAWPPFSRHPVAGGMRASCPRGSFFGGPSCNGPPIPCRPRRVIRRRPGGASTHGFPHGDRLDHTHPCPALR